MLTWSQAERALFALNKTFIYIGNFTTVADILEFSGFECRHSLLLDIILFDDHSWLDRSLVAWTPLVA